MDKTTYKNNSDASFTIQPGKWYNLTTGRYVVKIGKRWYIDQPPVAADKDQQEIIDFLKNNNLPTQNVLKKEPITKTAPKASVKPKAPAKAAKTPAKTAPKVPPKSTTKPPTKTPAKTAPKVPPKSITKTPAKSAPKPPAKSNKSKPNHKSPTEIKLPPIGSDQEEIWINFSYRRIVLKPQEWYNLETSHHITNLSEKTYLLFPRVAGPAQLMVPFLSINEIPLTKIKAPKGSKIKEELEQFNKQAQPHIVSAPSIDDVDDTDLQQLGTFAFQGLTVKGKVTYIVDGDTIDCSMLIPLMDMALPGAICVERKIKSGYNTMLCSIDNSIQKHIKPLNMLLKLRIRLYGVDAMEKETEGGQAATIYVQELIKKHKHRVWLQLMGTDVKGRTLAKIFLRNKGQQNCPTKDSLSELLINYKDAKHGQVAMPYYGDSNREQNWENNKH